MENKFDSKIKIESEAIKFALCERLSTTINDLSCYKQSKDINSIKYLECMASCHSLNMINNCIIGDPLDTEMFKVTQWTLEHEMLRNLNRNSLVLYPKNSEYKLKQVYQFDFLPELQRMSVIAKNNYDSKFNLYVKGSPEKIFELCRKDSLPKDYFEVLKKYTESGKRVIAFAFRELQNFNEEEKHNRTELELDLVFLGFLIFLNKLKPESISSIEKLKKGNVTTMMATGDNLLTGIAMAKACKILTSESVVTVDLNQSSKEVEFKIKMLKKGDYLRDSVDSNINKSDNEEIVEESKLLDNKHSSRLSQVSCATQILDSLFELMQGDQINSEIAITGKAFEHLVDLRAENALIDGYRARDIIKRILIGGRVYARMTPDHKELLIKELQDETGENIGMCGDGANDCKALKVADVGLSLSEAEASIAAPFTSNVQNISSAVELLKLGRFSLDIFN